jgi:hypothetical protein
MKVLDGKSVDFRHSEEDASLLLLIPQFKVSAICDIKMTVLQ